MKKYSYISFLIGMIFLQTYLVAEEATSQKIMPITYEINHKKYKGTEEVIEIDGKLYVEINELATFLGLNVVYKNHTIALTTPNIRKEDLLYFEEAVITQINHDTHKLTILPKSEGNNEEGEITIAVGNDTTIVCSMLERIFPFDVLKQGMKITVSCLPNNIQIVPYYKAYAIEILKDNQSLKELIPIIEKVYIVECNEEKQYIIVSTQNTDAFKKDEAIIVYIDDNTNIKDEYGKIDYTFKDLEVGRRITILTNGIMTKSKPTQTVGLEIILLLTSE